MRVGVPYATASVVDGRAACECPVCGRVFVSAKRGEEGTKGVGSATRQYALHYEREHEGDE